MPTRNVNLTSELDRFIVSRIESGQYANASEVVRTALRLLERDECEYEQKMTALRASIAEGDASPDTEDGVFESIFEDIHKLAVEKNKNVA